MIFHCFHKLSIGYKGKGVMLKLGEYYPDQPFVVVREATKEEWKEAHPEEWTNNGFFYEISTD